MAEPGPGTGPAPAALITGLAVLSALGRGSQAQLAGVLDGVPAFAPVRRFDVSRRRARAAATLTDAGVLADELVRAVVDACRDAGLDGAARATCPLFLAVHGGPRTAALAAGVAAGSRVGGGAGGKAPRVYTTACVSGSTALIDAAALIGDGVLERAVVAAGYLVEPDQFALFDAGLALSRDDAVRPFSAGRSGLLLGDAVTAVVVESSAVARRPALVAVAGWGRAGDAYHPVQPDPAGRGLARAIGAALRRAGIAPGDVGYVNANAAGSVLGDAAEAAALREAFGPAVDTVPVSSTKWCTGTAWRAPRCSRSRSPRWRCGRASCRSTRATSDRTRRARSTSSSRRRDRSAPRTR